MDTIAEIRRRHLVSKESISSIARDLKLSRPTVRKHCRTQREPVYRRVAGGLKPDVRSEDCFRRVR